MFGDRGGVMKLPVNYNKIHFTERRKVREEYIKLQDGKCYYCNSPLNQEPPKEILDKPVTERLYPDTFFKWPVHLHHDHCSGMTIGAVHCYCNAVLWEYENE